MRRSALTVVATIVGLVLLLQFKTHSAGSGTPTLASLGTVPVTSHSPRQPSGAGHTRRRTASPKPTASAPTTPATPKHPTTASSVGKPTQPRRVTATGQTIPTRYGPVQVRIVETAGHLTDVRAIQLPNSDSHSAQIAARAVPILRSEALHADSARIDIVSGATYTSDGYAQSLQSALDNA